MLQDRVIEEEVRPINPTLLVGLGGTGREVITRIRRNFVERYDDVRNYPIVGYFLIDTDETMQHYTPGLKGIIEQKINFSDKEIYMSTVHNVSNYTQRLNLYPHLEEWLYPNLHDIGDLNAGAAAIRPYGRLAFFIHQGTIRTNLTEALNSIRSPDARNKVAQNYNIQCGIGVSAYIICSLAGGTGSSMFLDTAFTLKDIARTQGITLELVGFLVLPGLYGKDKHLANGYAALKELEHHTRINNFEVCYEAGAARRTIPIPPFEYCYLIHNENEDGIPVTFADRESMFELLAGDIFLDFSNDDFAAHKRRIRVNFADQVSEVYSLGTAQTGTDDEGWSKRYMSLGYTSISYPADRIISCCAYNLAGKIFEHWGRLADVQIPVAGGSLADFVYKPDSANQGFLADSGLFESLDVSGKHDIIRWITRSGHGQDMVGEIRDWAKVLQGQIQSGEYVRQNMTAVDFLDRNIKLYSAKFISIEEPDPTKRGDFDRRIGENIKVFLYGGMLAGSQESITGILDQTASDGKIICGKIHNEVARMINDKIMSSAQMIQVLQEVKKRLGTGDGSYRVNFLRQIGDEQSKTGLYKDLEYYEKLMNDYVNDINEVLTERGQHASWPDLLPWSKWRRSEALKYDDRRMSEVLSNYTESLIAYFHTKLRILARRKSLDLFNEIIEYVDSLINELNRVNVTIRSLHSKANTSAADFKGKIESKLLRNIYDQEDIEEIYYPMGNSVDNIDYHSNEVNRKLSEMHGDRVTIVELPRLVDRFSIDRVLSSVVSYTRSVFEPAIRNLNIIEGVYEKKFPESQAQKRGIFIRDTYSFGKCWMVINEALPNLHLVPNNNRSYIVGHHVNPAKQQMYDLFDREIQSVRNTQIDPEIQFFETSDPSRILISTELAGFPLAAFRGINFMKEKYDAEYIQMGSTLHIDKNDYKYRDIIPVLNEVEQNRISDVRNCFVLGMVLGVLIPRVYGPNSQIVYEFKRDMHLEKETINLGVESKAKVALERNPQILREIKEEIMKREGKLLRQRDGNYNETSFRNYYLTVYWYSQNVYPKQKVDTGGGAIGLKQGIENRILQRKLDALADMYKRMYAADADFEWENFKQVALDLLRTPDAYSEEIPPFELTNRRVVKM